MQHIMQNVDKNFVKHVVKHAATKHAATWMIGLTGCLCTLAQADSIDTHTQRASISLSVGKMDVDASEFLFVPAYNHTMSRIDWETQHLNVLKADIAYAVSDRLTLGLRGWTSLERGNAVMDDFDWEAFGREQWTRWSHHQTSRQQYANQVDASATLWLVNHPAFKLGGVAGYEVSKFSWTSYGGHFIYEDLFAPPNTFRIFDMPDSVAAIGYKQTLKTPYLGLSTRIRHGKWSTSLLIKYSRWTKVHADDVHFQRPFYSRSNQRGGDYYAVMLNAGYQITDNTSVFIEGTYSDHRMSRGDNLMYFPKTGTSTYTAQQEVGSSNRSRMLSIGVRHAF